MASAAKTESANESVVVQGGQLPDLKKPTVALRFAEMWATGKLDTLTSGQQAVFLSALGEHIGVKAELGDIMLYQGKPYITISGYRRIAHSSGLLNGLTVEPASLRDRERFGAKPGEHLWVAHVHRKGSVKPYIGWGYVRENDKNPVTRTHPQEMAKKRAIYDGLRLAFPPSEVIGELHLTYIEEAEREAVRSSTVHQLVEGAGYDDVPEATAETKADDAVVEVPTSEQQENWEFQDDRALDNHPGRGR